MNELIDNNPYSFEDGTTPGRLYSFLGEFEAENRTDEPASACAALR